MGDSMYLSKQVPDPNCHALSLELKPKMEHCCHIWDGAAQSLLFSFDSVQNALRNLVGNELLSTLQLIFPQTSVDSLSLVYCYIHDSCSDGEYPLVLPGKTFTFTPTMPRK